MNSESTNMTIAQYLETKRASCIVCMWCCHESCPDRRPDGSLVSPPMPLAVGCRQFGDVTRWIIRYYFCSLGCVLAYIFHERCLPADVVSLNRHLAKLLLGIPMSAFVRRAPPRSTLVLFGGTRTIHQFRKSVHQTRLNTTIEIHSVSEFHNASDVVERATTNHVMSKGGGVHNVDTRRRHTRHRDLFAHKGNENNTLISSLIVK